MFYAELLSTMSLTDTASTSINGHGPEEGGVQSSSGKAQRKKVVVVGLGMVGVAFM